MEKTQENTDKLMSYIVKEEYSIQEHEDQIMENQNLESRQNEIMIEISFRCFVCGIGFGDAQSLFLHLASHGNPGIENSNTPILTCEENTGCQVKEQETLDCNPLPESEKSKTKKVTVPKSNHFDCDICGAKIRFEKTLRRHLREVHDMRNIYKCNKCPFIFMSKSNLRKHKDIKHSGKSLPGEKCEKTFTRAITLKEYEKNLRDQGNLECEICGIKVKNKRNFSRHMKDIHSWTTSYKCKECPKVFKSKFELVRHSGMHPIRPDVDKFNCETCGAKFQHQIGLMNHLKEHHPKDPIKSSQCLKTYSKSSNSLVPEKNQETQSSQTDCPEKKDSPEKPSQVPQVPVPPFVCKTCGAKFNSDSGFKWHLETHARKLFACIICNKTFQDYNNLAAHEKTHFFGDVCELPMNGESTSMHQATDQARKSPETARRSSTPEIVPITLSESSNSSEVDDKISIISIDSFHDEEEERQEPSHVSDLEEQKDTHPDELVPPQIRETNSKSPLELKRLKTSDSDSHLKEFECEKCGWKCKSKQGVKRHILLVHYGKKCHIRLLSQLEPFICSDCDSVFWERSVFAAHRSKHANSTHSSKILASEVRKNTLRSFLLLKKRKRTRIAGQTHSDKTLKREKTFKRSSSLEKRKETHPYKLYTCQTCKKSFRGLLHLKEHEKNHLNIHSVSRVKCEICGAELKHKKSLSRHLREVHGKKNTFKCENCPKICKTRSDLEKHEETHSVTCPICKKIFKLPRYLKKHEKIHETTCEICGTKLKHKTSLSRHLREVHGKTDTPVLPVDANRFQCQICPKTFATSSDLEKHKGSHPQKLYACRICGKTFKEYKYLRQHRRDHAATKAKCEISGKIIKYEYNMRRHLKVVHARTFICKCKQCPMKFRSMVQLQRHKEDKHSNKCEKTTPSINLKEDERIPMDDQGFDCEICGAILKYQKGLTRHMMEVHGKDAKTSTFKCKKCPRIFKSYSDLEQHKVTHRDELVNSQIKKTVKRLNGRKKTHSAVKAIECEKCGWKVKTKRGMKRHILNVHYGKKCHIRLLSQLEPYICPHCDRVFWEKSLLKVHLSRHD